MTHSDIDETEVFQIKDEKQDPNVWLKDNKIQMSSADTCEQSVLNTPKYTLYGYRHFELTLYCLAAMSNQMTWISLQPVAGAIQNGYGYGASTISALGITYMVVFLVVNYPANIIIDKGGLRLAVSPNTNYITAE